MKIKYFINPDINELVFEMNRRNIPRKRDFVHYAGCTYLVLSVCWLLDPAVEEVVHVHIDSPENVPVD